MGWQQLTFLAWRSWIETKDNQSRFETLRLNITLVLIKILLSLFAEISIVFEFAKPEYLKLLTLNKLPGSEENWTQ
jgi:hypothetical protein